ncbi:MAG TPA: GatB/YqeY domain-containing protein [Polyangiaceae bacterium]|nr:GatB/YqeY domain-containing protein [Polyangiaceae bacterium]
MTENVKGRLAEDLKAAMRAKDQVRLEAIRSVRAAILQREVDGGRELDEAAVLDVIRSLRKQRVESIEQYRAGGRDDLASREEREKELLEAYLPRAPDRDTIERTVRTLIAELGASSTKDMGRVMQAAKERLSGAEGKLLSEVVRALLRP